MGSMDGYPRPEERRSKQQGFRWKNLDTFRWNRVPFPLLVKINARTARDVTPKRTSKIICRIKAKSGMERDEAAS